MGKAGKSSSSSAPAKSPVEPIQTAPPAKKNNQRAKIVKSGNAGNSSNAVPQNSTAARDKAAIDEGRAPPLFPVGYKTPMTLLNERCQKNGWQKPELQPFKTPTGGHGCVIRLSRQDPKVGMESVPLRPPTSPESAIAIDKPTSIEAKHWGSIYALHRFASGLQLGMVLPPVCRDYWSALQADKKEVLAKNKDKAWQWDEDPFEAAREQKARLDAMKANAAAKAAAKESEAGSAETSGRNTPAFASSGSGGGGLPKDTPEVKMSSEMRKLVQETIRKMRELNPPSPPSSSSSSVAHTVVPEGLKLTKEEKNAVSKNLQALGYRKGHIESALDYFQTDVARYDPLLEGLSRSTLQDTVLQYLQITLAEEELPGHGSSSSANGYSHAQTHGHGYQSSDPTVRITKRHDKENGLARSWLVDKICKSAGYPEEAVEEAVEVSQGSEGKAILYLSKKLAGWQSDQAETKEDEKTKEELKEAREKMETEIEALESLLGNAIQRKGKISIEIQVRSSVSKASPPLILHVLLDSSCTYPSPCASEDDDANLCIPTFYLGNIEHVNQAHASSIPPYIRLHLTMQLLEHMRTDWRDILEAGEGGVIYEMVTFLQENMDEVLHHPPPSSEVFRFLRPGSDDALDDRLNKLTVSNGKSGANRSRNGRNGQPFPVGDSATLLKRYQALQQDQSYLSFLSKRKTLPAYSSRRALIDLTSTNRVVIVSGATGSGKTTQVPTFVLEDAIEKMQGEKINMVVTQPRRISAIGVATRVAQERTEELGKEGSLVGYAIRGERKASRECRLLFCTTGILLQRLSRGGDPHLDNVSHVFVDEVHERSLDSDFLLLILKEVLLRNKKIKIILMSATADSARFSSYFNNAPCIEIPGTTFPVEDIYLEDIIQFTRYKSPSSIKASRQYTDEENNAIKGSLVKRGIQDETLISTLGMLIRSEKIDYDLVASTVDYIHGQYNAEEAVLIFVTGVAEITQTIRAIERLPSSRSMTVLPLHANLTNAEQSRVFQRPPAGSSRRKVIVSTNVAETSITIDDIVHVIDTGRVKETRYDPISGVQRLIEDWNSLAGNKQRRGRSGRTKPGKCWKLFSTYQEEFILPKYTKPEILRTPLASLVLQVKALRGTQDVLEFLGNALDAPDTVAIQEALDTLLALGAIEDVEEAKGGNTSTASLTPLGQNLALLPLDLRLGKMLILASIFDCLEPMLYICAALSTKPLFASSPEDRDAAQSARNRFSTGHSDLLTDLNAISSLLNLQSDDSQGGGGGVGMSKNAKLKKFYEDNYISPSAWREIISLKSDFVSALKSAGFVVPTSHSSTHTKDGSSKGKVMLLQEKDENLLKAIIYAGTGKAVRIKLPQVRYEATIGGSAQIDHQAKEVRFFDGDDGRVFLHPGSILFSESKLKNGYLTYFNKSVTSKPFLRDATELPLYALLLFGRNLSADPYKGGLTISTSTSSKSADAKSNTNERNEKIHLRAPPRTSVLINELRRLMDLELEGLIDDPSSLIKGNRRSEVIESMMLLLRRNGS